MPKINRQSQKTNPFKKAVEATPDIANCYQPGLQALGKYSQKINLQSSSNCSGSVDIDACTTLLYPNDNRWDYVFAYKSKVYFIEVHSANTSEVNTVLRKLQWLKDWLTMHAPEIKKLNASQPYYWIQSGKFDILPSSPQGRLIALKGLRPIPKLNL